MSNTVSRRALIGGGAIGLAGAAGLVAACSAPPRTDVPAGFITRDGANFRKDGEVYRFVGANIWYGAYLGAPGPTGNRPRLIEELDTMKALGITNLRVLGASELSPLNNSLDPAFTTAPGVYNEDLLTGLDFLLAEMGKRDMKAVVYLTNFWEWSGGMVAYEYLTRGEYIDKDDPAHPWPAFADYSARFYKNKHSKALYWAYVEMILTRTNTVTGKPYNADATVMSWQLCNEPRPGGSNKDGRANAKAYFDWIRETARRIRKLAPHHLISLGHEGTRGAMDDPDMTLRAHRHVDYFTAHIWPQNWSWIDPADLPGSYLAGEAQVRDYIDTHIALAAKLGKPLVFEEFGFPRDEIAYEPGTPTTYKDRFYGMVYAAVEDAIEHDTAVAGSNFWAWGGAGRAEHADYHIRRGETAYVGDPPHEPQGWYSVFNTDESTQTLIRRHAQNIGVLTEPS
jgi:mannan endo-1,4-beta-mannosidase